MKNPTKSIRCPGIFPVRARITAACLAGKYAEPIWIGTAFETRLGSLIVRWVYANGHKGLGQQQRHGSDRIRIVWMNYSRAFNGHELLLSQRGVGSEEVSEPVLGRKV